MTKEEYLNMYKEDKLAEICEQLEEENKQLINRNKALMKELTEANNELDKIDITFNDNNALFTMIETLPAKDFIELYYMMNGLINNHMIYNNVNLQAIDLSNGKCMTTNHN